MNVSCCSAVVIKVFIYHHENVQVRYIINRKVMVCSPIYGEGDMTTCVLLSGTGSAFTFLL